MPQYDFQSPGANATAAIKQILVEREMQKRYEEEKQRQAMMDAMNQKAAEAQLANQAAAGKRADIQIQQQADQQKFGRAKDIAAMAGGEEVATPETAALFKEVGLGGRLEDRYKPGTPGIGVLQEDALPPDAQVGQTRQMIKPGFAYEQAREAEKARKDQAIAVAEMRAADAQLTREEREIARREAADLRRELQSNQIVATNENARLGREIRTDAAASKNADKAKADREARASALAVADSMRDAINDLATPDPMTGRLTLKPGTAKMVGGSRMAPGLPGFLGGTGVLPGALAEKIPGTQAADARAALQQIVGQRVVELMAEMKRQSRTGATGFGALSEKELAILQAASARLQTAQSDQAFADALQDVNAVIDRIYEQSDTSTPAPSGLTIDFQPDGGR